MFDNVSRRALLKQAIAAGALSTGAAGSTFWARFAEAAEKVIGITWGGYYADALKRITDKDPSLGIEWVFYQAASEEIMAKLKATWPNSPYDMCENWDPVYLRMYNEGWLETVTEADIPNIASIPPAILRYKDDKGVYAVPISLGATYWGYRKDMVEKPIRELTDLLDPSLKGKICLASPLKGSGITLVAMAVGMGGNETNLEPGWEFMKELAKSGNVGRIATAEPDITNSINSGETAITYWSPAAWNEVKKNWPCEILSKADSKSIKTFFYQEGFTIFKGHKRPEVLKVINYILEPDNNAIYNDALAQAPVNVNTKPSAAALDFTMTDEEYKKYAYFPNYAVMAKNHDALVKRWETEIQPLLRT